MPNNGGEPIVNALPDREPAECTYIDTWAQHGLMSWHAASYKRAKVSLLL